MGYDKAHYCAMSRPILSDYLSEIARIRATRAGTGEISYYGALAGALNAAGAALNPRVFCVPNLRNQGAGFPDMGLFLAERGQALENWPEARSPERGVIEADDIPADLSVKLNSAQVRRWQRPPTPPRPERSRHAEGDARLRVKMARRVGPLAAHAVCGHTRRRLSGPPSASPAAVKGRRAWPKHPSAKP